MFHMHVIITGSCSCLTNLQCTYRCLYIPPGLSQQNVGLCSKDLGVSQWWTGWNETWRTWFIKGRCSWDIFLLVQFTACTMHALGDMCVVGYLTVSVKYIVLGFGLKYLYMLWECVNDEFIIIHHVIFF